MRLEFFSTIFSVYFSSASAFVSASARLLFVCSYMEIDFFIYPLRAPQGNQHYIIAGNTLSVSSFCPLSSKHSANQIPQAFMPALFLSCLNVLSINNFFILAPLKLPYLTVKTNCCVVVLFYLMDGTACAVHTNVLYNRVPIIFPWCIPLRCSLVSLHL